MQFHHAAWQGGKKWGYPYREVGKPVRRQEERRRRRRWGRGE